MKTIGIIIREFKENNVDYIGIRNDLFLAFQDYDVNVIAIPINQGFGKLVSIVNLCDGIVLSGGNKFLDNDFKLVEYLYQNDIPTLGICLGMQTIGEYFNNKKEIEVNNHYHTFHEIVINKNSLLYKIIGQEKIIVNSRHHTALNQTNMLISAKYQDIIEAVEMPKAKFLIGVQWHPESLNDENSRKLFNYFVKIL